MVVAQQCFGLSDEGIEDAVYDSQAIHRFVGIDLAHRKTRYRGVARNPAQLQTLFGLANLVIAGWRLRARDALRVS